MNDLFHLYQGNRSEMKLCQMTIFNWGFNHKSLARSVLRLDFIWPPDTKWKHYHIHHTDFKNGCIFEFLSTRKVNELARILFHVTLPRDNDPDQSMIVVTPFIQKEGKSVLIQGTNIWHQIFCQTLILGTLRGLDWGFNLEPICEFSLKKIRMATTTMISCAIVENGKVD